MSGNEIRAALLCGSLFLACSCTSPGNGISSNKNSDSTALQFNGTSSYVDISGITSFGSATISYAVWICPKSMGGDRAIITRGTKDTGISLGVSNNRIWIGGNSGAGWDNAFINTLIPDEWYHLAAIYEENRHSIRLYVNGTLDTVVTDIDFQIDGENYKTFIGKNQFANVQHFSGIIDNVAIWNKAISAEEIADCMEGSLNGDESGLIAYFNFGEGSGKSTYDRTPNHYEGVFGDTIANELPAWVTVLGNH